MTNHLYCPKVGHLLNLGELRGDLKISQFKILIGGNYNSISLSSEVKLLTSWPPQPFFFFKLTLPFTYFHPKIYLNSNTTLTSVIARSSNTIKCKLGYHKTEVCDGNNSVQHFPPVKRKQNQQK